MLSLNILEKYYQVFNKHIRKKWRAYIQCTHETRGLMRTIGWMSLIGSQVRATSAILCVFQTPRKITNIYRYSQAYTQKKRYLVPHIFFRVPDRGVRYNQIKQNLEKKTCFISFLTKIPTRKTKQNKNWGKTSFVSFLTKIPTRKIN